MATETVKPFRREIDLGDGSGVQVFEGDTFEEFADLIAEAQLNATKKIQEQQGEIRTLRGKVVTGRTPDPYQDFPVFQPRDLTASEKWQLAQDLKDPNKAADALARESDRVEEARRKTREARDEGLRAITRAGREFAAATPDFVQSKENAAAIAQYMETNRMTPGTTNNWHIAYEALKAADALELRAPANGAPRSEGQQRDSATGGRGGDSSATPAAGAGDSGKDGWQARDRSSGLGNRSGAGTPRGGGRPQFPSVEELRRLHAQGKLAGMLQQDKKLAAYVDTLPAGSIV